MKRCCFSVVTIVFNGVSEIEATIKSVIEQENVSIQYVIIDGNSTDGTQEIVRKYADRIDVFVSEPDSGIYNAMNKGLALCNGDYVCFMNCGDRFDSMCVLSSISKQIESCGRPGFVYGTYREKNGKVIPNRNVSAKWYGMFASHQSMFYSLSVIKRNHIKYDESYRIAADYKFTLEVLAHTRDILRTKDCVAVFDTGGISCTNPDAGLMEVERARREVLHYGMFRSWVIRQLILVARFLKTEKNGIYKFLRY